MHVRQLQPQLFCHPITSIPTALLVPTPFARVEIVLGVRGWREYTLSSASAFCWLELVAAETLTPIEVVDRPCRVLVAAHYGATRLIDNVAVGPELVWT